MLAFLGGSFLFRRRLTLSTGRWCKASCALATRSSIKLCIFSKENLNPSLTPQISLNWYINLYFSGCSVIYSFLRVPSTTVNKPCLFSCCQFIRSSPPTIRVSGGRGKVVPPNTRHSEAAKTRTKDFRNYGSHLKYDDTVFHSRKSRKFQKAL